MLTRAAVFFAHQSVHTLAQLRQETLNCNSIQFWIEDNPVKTSDGSDGQVRVVEQTEEGHSRSCAAVGVKETEAIPPVLLSAPSVPTPAASPATSSAVL